MFASPAITATRSSGNGPNTATKDAMPKVDAIWFSTKYLRKRPISRSIPPSSRWTVCPANKKAMSRSDTAKVVSASAAWFATKPSGKPMPFMVSANTRKNSSCTHMMLRLWRIPFGFPVVPDV